MFFSLSQNSNCCTILRHVKINAVLCDYLTWVMLVDQVREGVDRRFLTCSKLFIPISPLFMNIFIILRRCM